jgi:hypothetical protein
MVVMVVVVEEVVVEVVWMSMSGADEGCSWI